MLFSSLTNVVDITISYPQIDCIKALESGGVVIWVGGTPQSADGQYLTAAKGSTQSTAPCSNTLECSGISNSKSDGDGMTKRERQHELHFTADDLFAHTSYFSKAPLRRTKECFVQPAVNGHRVLDRKDYLSNNNYFPNEREHQSWKGKAKDDAFNDITNFKSNPVEIRVEDEERFLPSNFFTDPIPTIPITNKSNGTQKVTEK